MTMSKGVVVVPSSCSHGRADLVTRAPVGQAVDEPGVAVVGEDDRPVGREERVELGVGEAVRMLALGLEAHEVDDVHEPHVQVRQPLAQERCGREGLERGNVTAAGQHDVRIAVLVRRPLLHAETSRAVDDGVLHREEVECRLLAGDDHVDVAAEAVIRDREQGVRVRRQVDADDLRLLVHDVVDEAGILVREAVVSRRHTCELRR